MYQGRNPIALQSQRTIAAALMGLMEQKDYAKIHVKELCERAEVSRQTFYSLFENKEELVRFQLDSMFCSFVEQHIANQKDVTLGGLCDSMLSYLKEQKDVVALLVQNNLDHVVKEKLEHYLGMMAGMVSVSKEPRNEYALAFFSGALMSMISLAVKRGELEHMEPVGKLIGEILSGGQADCACAAHALCFTKDDGERGEQS